MTTVSFRYPGVFALFLVATTRWLGNVLAFSTARENAEDQDDREAMRRVAQGDTIALAPLFDRWKLPLISFFYRSLGSQADAEDLVLKTFEQVWRAAPRYRHEARFASWLFAIGRNELRHELRRRKRKPLEPVDPDLLEWTIGSEAVETEHHTREMEEELLQALQTLPEKQRSALLLTAAEELSPAEIAATLGMSINALYVTLHRARNALRDIYYPHHENESQSPS
ncbi:MAG: RNA polymerase sigma factor [Verrucomicrobiae bacterium]|nr:RNA polymerase sigma factor [Verrucomicrobiae bacterium]